MREKEKEQKIQQSAFACRIFHLTSPTPSHPELSLDQFYSFLHEMEKVNGLLEVLS